MCNKDVWDIKDIHNCKLDIIKKQLIAEYNIVGKMAEKRNLLGYYESEIEWVKYRDGIRFAIGLIENLEEE